MNRQRSGFGLYAAFMVIIVLAMFYITGKSAQAAVQVSRNLKPP